MCVSKLSLQQYRRIRCSVFDSVVLCVSFERWDISGGTDDWKLHLLFNNYTSGAAVAVDVEQVIQSPSVRVQVCVMDKSVKT